MKLIYTALSKHSFYFREHISKFVLENDGVPLNPFMLFEYFLLDTIKRDMIRNANNTIVERADEVWVFGPISDRVLVEIKLAEKLKKLVRYFSIINSQIIQEITKDKAVFEENINQ